ncbi:ROOT GROWTH DEFECTIVE 3 [Arabidopsis thaliana]|uniref:TATA-binding protein-associated factor BTAF1 n=1 Tax=Arabidopsis thaliana TaxID=3702 RepID=BTAF1_ARATH|nr:ROOT GROWTH DEFECTIVE 3 [Arabidopsis thaliana]B5BT18.1 RecName: Full=TATA-binding protein-associated factor BTAF1; Short=AtBTAF1; AltName: Full=Protein BTAF1 homolog; AltName: Full=Protein ROOT GROWTH DEFECTIVE 3 [Arabidopsis thaliana]AEE79207.1 ROOT GROWTH DEFECTIVE 3 [Arabidopsis thaliana]BAG70033.1 homolog of human BTAF1 [Arabidopsis thaliana]|eukprot:NP_190996.3 ROOT GROWTH DEFECTIVE 3 [Arabidopsis thaliana]
MAQQQSSRLNRLLTLLDTGSTQATRLTAAKQIGDIAKSHPQDLSSLLRKVLHHLRSKKWDTRVAAAHAIGAIVLNVKHPSLSELLNSLATKLGEAGISDNVDEVVAFRNLQSKILANAPFRSFEMNKVLEFGALLASGGQEYDILNDNSKNPRDRVARQKKNLRRRLGLDMCEQFMDVNEMIRDEDLIEQKSNVPANGVGNRLYANCSPHHIQQFVSRMVPRVNSRRPSARELNLLKRKAKISSKDQAKGSCEVADVEMSSSHVASTSKRILSDSLDSSKADIGNEDDIEPDGDGKWPFHSFVEQLILDMFDPAWEIRHGSVMALREILMLHGGSAGVSTEEFSSDNGFELKDVLNKVTREREIDLNMQVSENELEPLRKRPKIEDPSKSFIDNTVLEVIGGDYDINVKDEDAEFLLPPVKVNGQTDCSSTKLEPQSSMDDSTSHSEINHVAEVNNHFEDKSFIEEPVIPKQQEENLEVLDLVKQARHSWIKNFEFLQDCTIRFLCVLSLDRFGDYISDQVVAPVREACAQALGATFKYMNPSLIYETLNILLQMQRRPEWEIRHGSLLGIKYLVAVRQEMLQDLLGYILPACKAGLEDSDDDVRAVAADALIPAAAAIVSLRGQTLLSIVMLLWDILLELDDLSPSTSSIMNLLAEIYSQDDMTLVMHEELSLGEEQNIELNEMGHIESIGERRDVKESPYALSGLAPRLWPFTRHDITSVRFSAIRTLERLLEAGCRKNISGQSKSSFWPSSILGDTLRIVFQNLLLESTEEILECSERVWRLLVQCPVDDLEDTAKFYMASWIELAATPYGSTLDATKMFWPVAPPRKSHFKAAAKMKAVKLENEASSILGFDYARSSASLEKQEDASARSTKIIVGSDMEMSVTRTRVVTASALGIFASRLREGSMQFVVDPLSSTLTSMSGVQRQVGSIVLISWFRETKCKAPSDGSGSLPGFPSPLKKWLLDLLACADPAFPTKDIFLPYAELSRTYTKMRNEASQLLHTVETCHCFDKLLSTNKLNVESVTADETIDFASTLDLWNKESAGNESLEKQVFEDVESSRQQLLSTAGYLKCVQSNLHITVTSLVAAAVVWMSEFPARLNPIILPLMASIKREQEQILQQIAAEALAELIAYCVDRKPSPNDKLIKNICSLTCMDPSETPQASIISSMDIVDDMDFLSSRSNTGKQKAKVVLASGEDRSKVEGFITRRGSELALKHLSLKFGGSLFDKLPKLWECLTEVLVPEIPSDQQKIDLKIESISDPQVLINNIQVVRSIAPVMEETLKPRLLSLLPCIFKCVRHSHVAVRLAASRCVMTMAKSMTTDVMAAVVESAIPMLGDLTCISGRQGAGMLIGLLVQGLGVELVPYSPLLVVPLLRCMSDVDSSVRQSVTRSFAALVPMLPLARGVPPPVGLSKDLSSNAEDAKFLEQLLDNSHIDDYKLCTELKVQLRRYQQEGINWLGFLKRFKLHGILCDDMGLGKTLQASAIVASDAAERRGSTDELDVFPSIIVCPSTLVGHWAFEIEKYIDLSLLSVLQYVGSAQDRVSLREQFNNHNVIITSYDVVRKDVDYLTQFSWNYCILDEGHIIKNAKSKITAAVKQLKAQHRLILSGTPIQNNIMELWSLFDFLMPGFLGTERQFQASYGKPLLAARDPKCSAKDAEAGVLAMEALHKQVMPFLLRRTKEEVLSDLPEKIIQDRYCDLSPVQLKLYEQFSGSSAKQEISSIIKVDGSADSGNADVAPTKASTHVFQALQYLLKLCSHPLLVLGDKVTEPVASDLAAMINGCSDIITELHKVQHSPKLVALQEILEECGIGSDASSSDGTLSVGQHRVLIFAQHKALLDIIEKDLFQAHMKSVTYMRLDGSVVPEKRFEIVKAFNSDPTIDVLLLTTHVGGLGLNLTSADTLVFMEHDWNPMRDHQAMDRAHRLGQKRVVNVHRLIMRGTLEEKVMSLQKFKVSVANTVINAENASMKTMNTDQLLDLFASAETSKKGGGSSKKGSEDNDQIAGTGKGMKAILGNLEELWDQSQYTEEYNLSQFLTKLNG